MATEILRPNADGDYTELFQDPSSGAHWDKVDEAVADDNTTQIYNNDGSVKRDLFNLPAHTGSGTINFVKLYFRCKLGDGSNPGYMSPLINSTVGTQISGSSDGWVTYTQTWTTNPADSQAWEWADIDALQVGVRNDAGGAFVGCTQVYVEVDYTEGPPTHTITASSGINGQIAPSGDVVVNSGGNQTFTITPDTGYIIDQILVDGSPV